MDKDYKKAQSIMEESKRNLEYIFKKGITGSFEDEKAYNVLENIIDKLDSSISTIKRYSCDTKEGRLYKLPNDKYAIDEVHYFSSGYPIEVYSDDEEKWMAGRIEHRDSDYYFYNYDGDNMPLHEGMKVRIRMSLF